MCVAILTKPNAVLTDQQLRSGAMANPDGGGFAYIDWDSKIVIKKGYFDVTQLIKDYRDVIDQGFGYNPMLVHFRIATQGKVNADNCHPFEIPDGAMIHNGGFWWGGGRGDEKSDTRIVAETYGSKFTHKLMKADPEAFDKAFIHNKVAFIWGDGSFHIVNEDRGHWNNDIWFSNSSCGYPPMNGGRSTFSGVGAASTTDRLGNPITRTNPSRDL